MKRHAGQPRGMVNGACGHTSGVPESVANQLPVTVAGRVTRSSWWFEPLPNAH